MADMAKLTTKKKNRFGNKITEASDVLDQPEFAPAEPKQEEETPVRKARAKTGRTVPFTTRVTAEFKKNLKKIAAEDEKFQAQILEEAFDMYCKLKGHQL